MNISSTIAYGPLPIDPTLQLNLNRKTDQVEPTTSISPASVTLPQAALSSRSGGLLSSINIGEVLKLTDAPPIDFGTLKEALGSRDLLGELIKRSKAAYAAGDASAAKSLSDKFTQKDVDTIRAATGYNVVVLNNLTLVVDDYGNPPPDDIAGQVQTMIGDVEGARDSGRLTGEITPDYLKEMFDKYAKAGDPLPEDWLDKALSSLKNTTDKSY